MKMRFKFFIVLIFFNFFYCKYQRNVDYQQKYKENVNRFNYYLLKFNQTGDSLFLKKTWFFLDSIEKNTEDSLNQSFVIMGKLNILNYQKKYFEAASLIENSSIQMVEGFSYFNKFLENIFKAKGYEKKGEINRKDSCLLENVNFLENVIRKNKMELDSLAALQNIDSILNNNKSIIFLQYYYLQTLLYGYETVEMKIDSLQEVLKGNKEFFKIIKDNCQSANLENYLGI